jgi:hypothetical protein
MNHNLNRHAGLFQPVKTASGKCAIFMKPATVKQNASNNCDEYPELLSNSLEINVKLRNSIWSAPQKDWNTAILALSRIPPPGANMLPFPLYCTGSVMKSP